MVNQELALKAFKPPVAVMFIEGYMEASDTLALAVAATIAISSARTSGLLLNSSAGKPVDKLFQTYAESISANRLMYEGNSPDKILIVFSCIAICFSSCGTKSIAVC